MAAPCSAGSAPACSTSAKSIDSSTSPSARTGRSTGTFCASGSSSNKEWSAPPGRRSRASASTPGAATTRSSASRACCFRTYHYRDKRTDGVMEAVFERVSADEIYAVTGIQFLPFNTLYQLYAACQATPRLLDAAMRFGTIPDLINYWLTGDMTAEFTNATTTQFIDARTRSWATDLLQMLEVPTRILPPIVEPGRSSATGADAHPSLQGTRVVAPACHDTGSAVAAVRADGHRAFLSSGTWSLLDRLSAPVIGAGARAELHQ